MADAPAPATSEMALSQEPMSVPTTVETALNEASRRRLARAQEIAPIYVGNPKVQALVVGGSVARGCADRYSDVEIGVFWSEHPSEAEFEAAMRLAGGSRWELDRFDAAQEDVHYEEYEVDGLKIDLRHMRVDRMERVLTAVLDEFETGEEWQTIVWVRCLLPGGSVAPPAIRADSQRRWSRSTSPCPPGGAWRCTPIAAISPSSTAP